jgi:hypothetical protein
MNETPETPAPQGSASAAPAAEPLAAIVREMRAAAKSTDLFDGEEVGEPLIRGTKVEEWADRIEAAAEWKRNAAQFARDMRDAMYYAATEARPFVGMDFAKGKPTYTRVEIDPCNAAAMRGALSKFLDLSRRGLAFFTSYRYTEAENDEIEAAFDEAKSALSAPARNCDVGTADEQMRRFDEFCMSHKTFTPERIIEGKTCTACPCMGAHRCQVAWGQMLFAPAKENGGNKQ